MLMLKKLHLLLRSKRREKCYDCMFRLRFLELLLPARLEEERLLDAEIAAENQRNRGRKELDAFCHIAQT